MSLFDFFVSFSNKIGLSNKDNNLSHTIKTNNTPFAPITISIDRDSEINSALAVIGKVKHRITKVTNYKTMPREHGKTFWTRGVQVHHTNAFRLKYNGTLAQTDANIIYAVTGTGSNNSWENIRHIPMYRMGKGFETLVSYDGSTNQQNEESNEENAENYIHFAFKDHNNNWDNNLGSNYSFNIDLLTGNNSNK